MGRFWRLAAFGPNFELLIGQFTENRHLQTDAGSVDLLPFLTFVACTQRSNTIRFEFVRPRIGRIGSDISAEPDPQLRHQLRAPSPPAKASEEPIMQLCNTTEKKWRSCLSGVLGDIRIVPEFLFSSAPPKLPSAPKPRVEG
jgi:hypothetical protein